MCFGQGGTAAGSTGSPRPTSHHSPPPSGRKKHNAVLRDGRGACGAVSGRALWSFDVPGRYHVPLPRGDLQLAELAGAGGAELLAPGPTLARLAASGAHRMRAHFCLVIALN